MEFQLKWPPTSQEWNEFRSSGFPGMEEPEEWLLRIVDLWNRAQGRGIEGQEASYQLEDLVEDSLPLAALFTMGERPSPRSLEMLLRVVEAPPELEDEVFGDILSEAWEPLVLTVSTQVTHVDRLAATALCREVSVLGRMSAITGLATLARSANAHPLEAASRARLESLVQELQALCEEPSASDDDAEVFSDALSAAVLAFAPHSEERKAQYGALYHHPRAVHQMHLGSHERFLADLHSQKTFYTEREKWPFQAMTFVENFYGDDAVILAERARIQQALRSLVEREMTKREKRKSKRKAQKSARKKKK
jgi:hypothetical protein